MNECTTATTPNNKNMNNTIIIITTTTITTTTYIYEYNPFHGFSIGSAAEPVHLLSASLSRQSASVCRTPAVFCHGVYCLAMAISVVQQKVKRHCIIGIRLYFSPINSQV